MTKQLTYIAGDIMTRGSQLQRAEERDKLLAAGINVYTPQDNKKINDKQSAIQEGLAERIVREDMERIFAATEILIEPQPHAQGTLIELGIIYGMKALAAQIEKVYGEAEVMLNEGATPTETDGYIVNKVSDLGEKVLSQKIYAHNSDIRRTEIPEQGDRRSFSVNQFLYGVVLDLTNGKGFYDLDEAIEEIKKNGVLCE